MDKYNTILSAPLLVETLLRLTSW